MARKELALVQDQPKPGGDPGPLDPDAIEQLPLPDQYARSDLETMFHLGLQVSSSIGDYLDELAEFEAATVSRGGLRRRPDSPVPSRHIIDLRREAAVAGCAARFTARAESGAVRMASRFARADLMTMWRLGHRVAAGVEDLVGELAEHYAHTLDPEVPSREVIDERIAAAFAGAAWRYVQRARVHAWAARQDRGDDVR